MYSSILPDDPEIWHMMASYPILRSGSDPTCSMLTWFPESRPNSENGPDIRKHSGAGHCEIKLYLWVLIWLQSKMLNLCWALTQLRGEDIATDREPMMPPSGEWRGWRGWRGCDQWPASGAGGYWRGPGLLSTFIPALHSEADRHIT